MNPGHDGPIEKVGLRIRNESILRVVRQLPWCEVCGVYRGPGVTIEPHHVETRGAGGDDSWENLLGACVGIRSNWCHRRIHTGEISADEVVEILERRLEEWRERGWKIE